MDAQTQMLLNDLCARLPHGFYYQVQYGDTCIRTPKNVIVDGEYTLFDGWQASEIKPYLRPLTSMTDDELKYIKNIFNYEGDYDCFVAMIKVGKIVDLKYESLRIFFISHHFDYQGFIPMGLALEAPDGMYKI